MNCLQGKTNLYVYIAGPITHGDRTLNLRTAILAADVVWRAKHFVFVPHLNDTYHLVAPHDYESWLAFDFAWLAKCDVLVRLPGISPGADREVVFATEHGIPVFYGVMEFLDATRLIPEGPKDDAACGHCGKPNIQWRVQPVCWPCRSSFDDDELDESKLAKDAVQGVDST